MPVYHDFPFWMWYGAIALEYCLIALLAAAMAV